MKRQIHESAYKHGIRAADMLHVMDHPTVTKDVDDDRVLYLGWSTDGVLLEVLSYLPRSDLELIVHARPIRRRYEALLPHSRRRP